MVRAFSYYGEAIEVVIPPKRDALGRRFGFVRFRSVSDPRMLAIKLDNILIGSSKIHVNIPRFRRDWNEKNVRSTKVRSIPLKSQAAIPKGLNGWKRKMDPKAVNAWKKKEDGINGRVEQIQQRRTWQPKVQNNPLPPKIVYHRKIDLSEICYNVDEEKMLKFNKMYVGVVKIPGSSYSIQEWLNVNGVFSIRVTPLGANKVLLEELVEGTIQELIDESEEWLREKLDVVRRWSPGESDAERIVWLRCHGIPVHAWNEEFFASLARKYGVLVGVDDATRRMSSLDVARICIRTRIFDVFNMVVVANINESLFNIKMVEEWCGPQKCSCLLKSDGDGVSAYECESACSEDSDDGGPGLFTAVDGGFGSSESEEEAVETLQSCNGVDDSLEVVPATNVNSCVPDNLLRSNHAVENDCVGQGMSPTLPSVVECNNPIGCNVNVSLEDKVEPQNLSRVGGCDASIKRGLFGGIFEWGETSKAGGARRMMAQLSIVKGERKENKEKVDRTT